MQKYIEDLKELVNDKFINGYRGAKSKEKKFLVKYREQISRFCETESLPLLEKLKIAYKAEMENNEN
jgi:hypothetical protein